MANLKNFKKDVDYICEQVVLDCLLYAQTVEESKLEEIEQIMNEALVLNAELRKRANHPDGKENSKLVKEYYKKLIKDLIEKCNAMYDKLNSIA